VNGYKLFISVSIPAVVLFFAAARQCPADVLERLEQVETYKWYPAQAETIYRQIKADYPGSEYALAAHKNLVTSYLSAKRYDDAVQSLNQLTADFAGHTALPAVLYDVAKVYERARKYETAKGLYQQIAQQYPDSAFASKVQLDLPKVDILYNIESKKYNEVVTGIETLVNDFNGDSYLTNCLYDIARRYERAKKYTEAENLYNRIIREYPESFGAGGSQLALRKINIYSLIESGSETAGEAVEALLAEFSGRPGLSEALYDIAIRFDRVKDYGRAKSIYQKITEKFPISSHAARAPLDISRIDICSLIDSDDEPNAAAALDSLAAGYSGHSYLPKVLLEIAKRYKKLGKYDAAERINKLAAKQHIDSSFADHSRLRIAKINILRLIDSGQDEAALAAIDKLIIDFNDVDHSRLAKALLQSAEQYYTKACRLEDEELYVEAENNFTKAASIAEKVYHELPSFVVNIAPAYYFSAVCYRHLSRYEKAIEYYRKVVDEWPDYVYSGDALYWIGQCFESLRQSGMMSVFEANKHIKQPYDVIIKKYPDCEWFKYACLKLGQISFEAGQWLEAAQYFELFLQRCPENHWRNRVLYPLGRAYDKMGQLDLAAEIYTDFIKTTDTTMLRAEKVKTRLEELRRVER